MYSNVISFPSYFYREYQIFHKILLKFDVFFIINPFFIENDDLIIILK